MTPHPPSSVQPVELGAELTLALGLDVDATGLTVPPDPATALAMLPRLRHLGATWRWVVGDLVLALCDGDTSRLHVAWQQITDLDIDDRPSLMRSVAVAHAIPHHRRIPALTWSHHQAVAGEEPDVADEALALAAEHRWTVRQLEDHLAGPADDEPTPLPLPKTPAEVLRAAVPAITGALAADPTAAVVVRLDDDGQPVWRVLTEPR